MDEFLHASEVVDWHNANVRALATELAADSDDAEDLARRAFAWVRDNVRHSADYELNPVTWRASDVLAHQTGYCYAKSHLLAALLRANGIPVGFCYQRLWADEVGDSFVLHGFNALYLPSRGWYRVDARGNRPDINAQFDPPNERLAYTADQVGELTLPGLWAEPLPLVVSALQACETWDDFPNHRPDIGSVSQLTYEDPRRMAILLIGGDKSGEWNAWYERMIPAADELYDEHLRELRRERLLP